MASLSSSTSEKDKLDDYLASRQVINRRPVAVVVDGFRFVSACRAKVESSWGTNEPARVLHFLTHFHSDHYAGLSPSVARLCGVVYTSRATASLVVSQLKVPPELTFALDYGTRYCFSLVTGELLAQTSAPHGVADHVDEIEQDQPTLLPAGVAENDVFYLHLIQANHCPGSSMLLFTSSAFGSILHTGDFRFNGSVASWRRAVCRSGSYWGQPPLPTSSALARSTPLPVAPFYETFLEDDAALRRVVGHVDTLFLDNTFCDPAFKFFPQWQATQATVDMLRTLFLTGAQQKREALRADSESSGGRHDMKDVVVSCALLVGTYSIGKERIAFAVQEAFPPVEAAAEGSFVPVYVTPQKRTLMHEMSYYPQRFRSLVSTAAGSRVSSTRPSSSLASDQHSPLSESEGEGETNAEASGILSDAIPEPCEVRLPQNLIGGGDGVALSDTSHDPDAALVSRPGPRTRFLLTIVLVPLGSVTYPPIAAASGRPLKRQRGDSGSDTAASNLPDEAADRLSTSKPLLDVGEGLGLDLSRYDRVLGVEPTGWARKLKSQRVTDRTWLLRLPYSEHCAFHELISFVGFVNPAHVVPTVSLEAFKQHEPLFAERASRLASRWANTQPLSRFFTIRGHGNSDASGGPRHPAPPHAREVLAALPAERKPEQPEAKAVNPFSGVKPQRARGGSGGGTAAKNVNVAEQFGTSSSSVTAGSTMSCGPDGAITEVSQSSADDGGVVVVAVKHTVVEISDDDEGMS